MKLPRRVSVPQDIPYLSNKYTQWYYSLIMAAKSRTTVDGYTEDHHIIPKCMFIANKRKSKSFGFLAGNPDSSDNLVTFSYREHVIAHWLLVKMTQGTWRYRMEVALSQFRFKKTGITPLEVSRIKTANKQRQLGLIWWNNGEQQILCDKCPSDSYTKGMLPSNNQGASWWNNGVINTLAMHCPGPEWQRGRTPGTNSTKGYKWWNNGQTSLQSRIHPGDGWSPGRFQTLDQQLITSEKLKGTKWWFNGVQWKRSQICPGPEWVLAKRSIGKSKMKGKTFWHKDTVQRISVECPGPGWLPGRIPNTSASIGKSNINKGRKLWNNGIDQKTAHDCPGDGWVMGRLR